MSELTVIANESISAAVSSRGAELCSLRLKATDTEFIWQPDPAYWDGQAPNLFPICGRLWDGKYTYQGKEYRMDIHGFARVSEFTVKQKTDTAVTFELTENPETLKQYPFCFKLSITYLLAGNSLTVRYHVENTDEKQLIFTLGGHPGFNVPFEADGTDAFDHYSITFSEHCAPDKLVLSERKFYTDGREPVALKDGRSFGLYHSMFDNDAIFMEKMAKSLILSSSSSVHRVKMDYEEMNYIGLWHATGLPAPYVCIEPWIGVPAYDGAVDRLENKLGMIHLDPEGHYECGYSITVE